MEYVTHSEDELKAIKQFEEVVGVTRIPRSQPRTVSEYDWAFLVRGMKSPRIKKQEAAVRDALREMEERESE